MNAPSRNLVGVLDRMETFVHAPILTKSGKPKKNAHSAWPHDVPTRKAMAYAGFFFDPTTTNPDNARCFMCDHSLDGWEPQDNPVSEHLQHSPDCTYAQLLAMSGVPGWLDDRRVEYSSLSDPYSEESVQLRLATFGNLWPHDGKRGWRATSSNLAKAGFYYAPERANMDDDTSTCPYCEITLAGWEPRDDPIKEHKKRSPNCLMFTTKETVHVTEVTNGSVDIENQMPIELEVESAENQPLEERLPEQSEQYSSRESQDSFESARESVSSPKISEKSPLDDSSALARKSSATPRASTASNKELAIVSPRQSINDSYIDIPVMSKSKAVRNIAHLLDDEEDMLEPPKKRQSFSSIKGADDETIISSDGDETVPSIGPNLPEAEDFQDDMTFTDKPASLSRMSPSRALMNVLSPQVALNSIKKMNILRSIVGNENAEDTQSLCDEKVENKEASALRSSKSSIASGGAASNDDKDEDFKYMERAVEECKEDTVGEDPEQVNEASMWEEEKNSDVAKTVAIESDQLEESAEGTAVQEMEESSVNEGDISETAGDMNEAVTIVYSIAEIEKLHEGADVLHQQEILQEKEILQQEVEVPQSEVLGELRPEIVEQETTELAKMEEEEFEKPEVAHVLEDETDATQDSVIVNRSGNWARISSSTSTSDSFSSSVSLPETLLNTPKAVQNDYLSPAKYLESDWDVADVDQVFALIKEDFDNCLPENYEFLTVAQLYSTMADKAVAEYEQKTGEIIEALNKEGKRALAKLRDMPLTTFKNH